MIFKIRSRRSVGKSNQLLPMLIVGIVVVKVILTFL